MNPASPSKPPEANSRPSKAKPGVYALRGQLRDDDLWAPVHGIRARRPAEITAAWTKETREPDGQIIRQAIVEKPPAIPDRVILVLDATKGMESCLSGDPGCALRLPPNIDFALLLARDGCEEVMPLQKAARRPRRQGQPD